MPKSASRGCTRAIGRLLDEDVRGLHVLVDDADGMRRRERPRHPRDELEPVGKRHAAGGLSSLQPVRCRMPPAAVGALQKKRRRIELHLVERGDVVARPERLRMRRKSITSRLKERSRTASKQNLNTRVSCVLPVVAPATLRRSRLRRAYAPESSPRVSAPPIPSPAASRALPPPPRRRSAARLAHVLRR